MGTKKQIEEMAIIINGSTEMDTMGYYRSVEKAKNIYNAGYRKIPENAVVLTDKKDIQQFEWSKMLDKMGFFKFADNLRKETAEKFARLAKKWNEEAELGCWVEVELEVINNAIDDICKEITEGKV